MNLHRSADSISSSSRSGHRSHVRQTPWHGHTIRSLQITAHFARVSSMCQATDRLKHRASRQGLTDVLGTRRRSRQGRAGVLGTGSASSGRRSTAWSLATLLHQAGVIPGDIVGVSSPSRVWVGLVRVTCRGRASRGHSLLCWGLAVALLLLLWL